MINKLSVSFSAAKAVDAARIQQHTMSIDNVLAVTLIHCRIDSFLFAFANTSCKMDKSKNDCKRDHKDQPKFHSSPPK